MSAFCVFAGTVERVDDPYPTPGQPGIIDSLFFRQQAIARSMATQQVGQQGVGQTIAMGSQVRGCQQAVFAQPQQVFTGSARQARRQLRVIEY
jgi:hypothetical protein